MKIIRVSLLTVLLGASPLAFAQSAETSNASERAEMIRGIGQYYQQMSSEDRDQMLKVMTQLVSSQLPYQDVERGVQVNRLNSQKGQLVTVAMNLLADGPLAGVDPDLLTSMVPPFAKKLACADETLRPILDLGIRIQVDLADVAGQHLAKVEMDSGACKPDPTLEDSLDALGVE